MAKLALSFSKNLLRKETLQASSFWRITGLALVLTGFGLSLSATTRKSVTVDEFQALPSGLAVLRTGDLRYPQGTPPLSQILPALPLLFSAAQIRPVEGRNANWAVAHGFAELNAENFHFYFFVGRLVSALVLAFTLFATGLLAFRLYGEKAAALALFCAVFNPNLLAHGSLLTPDIYFSAAVMLYLLCLDRLFLQRNSGNALLLGAAIGVSCLMKLSGLALFFLTPACLVLWQRGAGARGFRTWLGPSLLAFFAALVVIQAGYFFQAPLWRPSAFVPESELLGSLSRIFPSWLALPLPSQFMRAIDQQLGEAPYLSYLLGEFNRKGFYTYYLLAFLVKTPSALFLLAALAWFSNGRIREREWPLVLILGFFFVFFSLARYKNLGLRYLLFLYPVLTVWTGRLATESFWRSGWQKRAKNALVTGCCGSLFLATLFSWPDYLAYFNLPSGGPQSGHRYLLDSNLDWGQDLTTLKDFMTANQISSIDLAHFGPVNPGLYGIDFTTLNGPPTQRYIAISANFLWGRSYFVNGTSFYPEHLLSYQPYQNWKPIAILGNSIYVYDAEKIEPLRALRARSR